MSDKSPAFYQLRFKKLRDYNFLFLWARRCFCCGERGTSILSMLVPLCLNRKAALFIIPTNISKVLNVRSIVNLR